MTAACLTEKFKFEGGSKVTEISMLNDRVSVYCTSQSSENIFNVFNSFSNGNRVWNVKVLKHKKILVQQQRSTIIVQ